MATAAQAAATAVPATIRRAGPPVPPRPQHTSNAAGLLRTQRESVMNASAMTSRIPGATSNRTTITTTSTGATSAKITMPTTPTSPTAPAPAALPQKRTMLSATQSAAAALGRTIIYRSPTPKQEERDRRVSADGSALPTPTTTRTSALGAPKPPLKLRKAPDVPHAAKSAAVQRSESAVTVKSATESPRSPVTTIPTKAASVSKLNVQLGAAQPPAAAENGGIVIVHSSPGINLNRHNSMGSPKTVGLRDVRLSLNRADSEKVTKIQLDQLQTGQPLPKPRKIVKVPVATMEVEERAAQQSPKHSSPSISLFKRSKTTLDSIAARASVTTINASPGGGTSGGFLSGKTVELKNNLRNAAERLFSEIIVSQQKQSSEPPATIITKHERAVQHQALLEQEIAQERQKRRVQAAAVTVVPATPTHDGGLTRINIKANANAAEVSPAKSLQAEHEPNTQQRKAAFHEILISEIAAMRAKSSSMENLQARDSSFSSSASQRADAPKVVATSKSSTTLNNTRQRCNSIEDHEDPDTEDVDADNVEDTEGDDDELNKTLKVVANNTPRKRCPSGCSSDSSPYGTERSTRIRTSDWIEVGDNGKQVTLTSCHISLEDSGLEDEERLDDVSSSGVGDSWDSVKEAENEKRCRSVKRVMSITDLPPLPKSLSGINKMLGSDSGLISDADNGTETNNNNNNNVKLECQKDKNTKNNNNCDNVDENEKDKDSDTTLTQDIDQNDNDTTITATTITAAAIAAAATPTNDAGSVVAGCTLDKQLATLRKEMFGLRQLDLSLLSQLWALNDSIQEFRTMLEEQEHDHDDDDSYSPHSRTPSSYESGSSDGEDNITSTQTKPAASKPNIITTQPKLSTQSSSAAAREDTPSDSEAAAIAATPSQQRPQLAPPQRPPLPKPLDGKPVPRMRTAPPPPPAHRKSAAPPRPT